MIDAGMGWTDDRVALLSKLWVEGLSASQIAAALGGGVTRNAVIGKVHRLGLSGRGKAGQPAAQRPSKPRPPAAAGPDGGERPAHEASAATSSAESASGPAHPVPLRSEVALVQLPVSERVNILDLRDTMCRWPIGDPSSPDFGFCGARSVTGLPYCSHHCSLAYQPAAERRRLRA